MVDPKTAGATTSATTNNYDAHRFQIHLEGTLLGARHVGPGTDPFSFETEVDGVAGRADVEAQTANIYRPALGGGGGLSYVYSPEGSMHGFVLTARGGHASGDIDQSYWSGSVGWHLDANTVEFNLGAGVGQNYYNDVSDTNLVFAGQLNFMFHANVGIQVAGAAYLPLTGDRPIRYPDWTVHIGPTFTIGSKETATIPLEYVRAEDLKDPAQLTLMQTGATLRNVRNIFNGTAMQEVIDARKNLADTLMIHGAFGDVHGGLLHRSYYVVAIGHTLDAWTHGEQYDYNLTPKLKQSIKAVVTEVRPSLAAPEKEDESSAAIAKLKDACYQDYVPWLSKELQALNQSIHSLHTGLVTAHRDATKEGALPDSEWLTDTDRTIEGYRQMVTEIKLLTEKLLKRAPETSQGSLNSVLTTIKCTIEYDDSCAKVLPSTHSLSKLQELYGTLKALTPENTKQ